MIPITGFALLAADLFFRRQWTPTERQVANFFACSVFLNVIHVGFTFALLLTVPQCRSWIRELSRGRPWLFWAGTLAAFSLFWAFFAFYNPSVFLMLLFVILLPLWHEIRQIFGLSAQYTFRLEQGAGLSEADRQRLRRCSRAERMAFRVLIALVVAGEALLFARAAARTPLLDRSLDGVVLALGLVVCALLGIGWRIRKLSPTYKPIYLLRVVYYPLRRFSVAARLMSSVVHGTEYYFVSASIADNARLSQREMRRLLLWLWGVSLVVLALLIVKEREPLSLYFLNVRAGESLLAQRLTHVLMAFIFTHYCLDAVLFRMSHDTTRKWIGPLMGSNRPRT